MPDAWILCTASIIVVTTGLSLSCTFFWESFCFVLSVLHRTMRRSTHFLVWCVWSGAIFDSPPWLYRRSSSLGCRGTILLICEHQVFYARVQAWCDSGGRVLLYPWVYWPCIHVWGLLTPWLLIPGDYCCLYHVVGLVFYDIIGLCLVPAWGWDVV